MKVLFKQNYAVVTLVCLLITSSCTANKNSNDNEDCYDVESLKNSLKNLILAEDTPLGEELESNNKNLSEIKAILGEPIREDMDTFKFSRHVNSSDDFGIDRYYYAFPDSFWRLPRLIIHRCVWAKGNKDITLFFANNRNDGEQPFWGYVREYDDFYMPLRLLPEKKLTLNQVINKRGKPNKSESLDTLHYGVGRYRNIYSLRNIPEAVIHSYSWYVGGSHTLRLTYLENENKNSAKPVAGYLAHNIYFTNE